MFRDNIILLTDSYKVTHHLQYPANTTTVYSYFESRGGKYDYVCFFGLQYILKRYFTGCVVTLDMVDEAEEVYTKHFGANHFNRDGWMYIIEKHNGHLPIRVKAVPEGTIVDTKNVLFTVENTDPECYWLTNFFETLLVQTWYPMTVATNSRQQKIVIARYLDETADNRDGLPFKLHDFGFRGASSVESAGIGDCAHLVNFMGTDTIAGLMVARRYYNCNMAGFSIPATEHSTITTWGREGETEAFRNMLIKFPDGPVACVSDSYDIWAACENIWGGELRSLVMARTTGPLVVRPDSGDPATVVCKILDILGEKFGTITNTKGYKMLPPYLRIIQGDGICCERIEEILNKMKQLKWSADNLAFGSGGALLQKVLRNIPFTWDINDSLHHIRFIANYTQMDRDTQKCAYKCSYCVVAGESVEVYKAPITDTGKTSKRGRLTLQRTDNGCCGDSSSSSTWTTVQHGQGDPKKDELKVVFENGKLIIDQTLEEIRKRADINPQL